MKVLMFGWEFPPHISGGLGTACYGLTNSLSKENIDILFVVPRLYGEESAGYTNFIDASGIPIASKIDLEQYLSSSSKDAKVRQSLYNVLQKEGITHIEVPSALSPYRALQFEQQSPGIEHWNYSLGSGYEPTKEVKKKIGASKSGSAKSLKTTKKIKDSRGRGEVAPFKFSGVYGPDLLDEVKRYAQVGASIARKYSFDVIHAHDWMTYLAGIAAKKVSGKPLVVHVHATEHDRSGENVDQSVYAIEHFGMAGADKVIAVSEWTKKIAVSRYHVPEEKVEVVYNGILPKSPSSTHTSPSIGSHIVTFLGRITHQKGPMYFVEAARKVLDQIPDAHFIMAGSGDLLPMMIERIAQLRMSSHFHFTGFLKENDIDKVWSMSSVYVMPSVSEPFGISTLEAIQAGVPVILSRQSGVAEIMPHAIRVDFWNSQELAGAICSVLKYRSLSNTLRKNSTEEISTLTWNNAAKKLTHLYRELTTEKRCA